MDRGGRGWALLARGLALLALIAGVAAARVEAAPGDLDPSFGTGGVVTTTVREWSPYTYVTELMIDAQGRIVAAGISEAGGFLVRYLADGTLDTSFGTSGITVDGRLYWWLPPPYGMAADGRIYAGGFADIEGSPILLRYDEDGRPDPSFGMDGVRALEFEASEIVPLAGGKMLIAGNCLARLLPDGSYDPTFALSCWRGFRSLAFPTPDTIVAAGVDGEQSPPAIWRVTIGRFLADGTPDPAAGALPVTASPPLPFWPVLVAVQPDGRVVAVDEGEEGFINLARVNLDGSLDPTFGTGGLVTIMRPWGWGSSVGALAIQRDGRILVGGKANVIGHEGYHFFVARFLPDGTLDPSFGDAGIVTTDVVAPPPYGYQDVVYAFLEDAAGRILAGGASHHGGDDGPVAVARYHGRPCGDGVLDVGEACDAGAANGTTGSCCAADCTARSDGNACSTSNACLTGERCVAGTCGGGTAVVCPACDTCDPGLGCRFAPRLACRDAAAPVRARFRFRDSPRPNGRRLTFSWKAGEPLASADVGDPLAAADYALCVYDEAEGAPRLRLAAGAPAGGLCGTQACWRQKGDRLDYRDPAADPEGVTKIQIDRQRGTLTFTGRGPRLASLPSPLGAPTIAELRVRGGGCWRLTVPPPR